MVAEIPSQAWDLSLLITINPLGETLLLPLPHPISQMRKLNILVGVSHTGHPIRNQESWLLLWGLSLSSWVTFPPHISSFASLSY